MVTIYHNSRCRKSREGLQFLRDAGIEPQIIEYLKTPPKEDELRDLLKKMGKKPVEIIRKGEDIYKKEFKGKDYSDDEWISILVSNPKLIERPIVVNGSHAVLGRPAEAIGGIL